MRCASASIFTAVPSHVSCTGYSAQWAISLDVRMVIFRELCELDEQYHPNDVSTFIGGNRVAALALLDAIVPLAPAGEAITSSTPCPTAQGDNGTSACTEATASRLLGTTPSSPSATTTGRPPIPASASLRPRPHWHFLNSMVGFFYYGEHFLYEPSRQSGRSPGGTEGTCVALPEMGTVARGRVVTPAGWCHVSFETSSYRRFHDTLVGFGPISESCTSEGSSRAGQCGSGEGAISYVVQKLIFHPDGTLSGDWHYDSCVVAGSSVQR